MNVFAQIREPGPLPVGGRGGPPLVLAVHGSAAPAAVRTVDRLCSRLAALTGSQPLVGHLDVQRPSLGELLGRLAGYAGAGAGAGAGAESGARAEAVVVPLLLGDGFHRAVDVPAVVAAATGVRAVVTPGLSGAAESVGLALYGRLRETEERAGGPADAVVVAAAGSTRLGGNDGALAAADRLAHLLGGTVPVRTAYCSAARPTVPQAVADLRTAGHRRIAVAAHLLAPGRFTAALPASGAWAVTAPLADHPLIARAVLRRYAAGLRELTLS
ncbi:sirohydrochlorin chelatase [Kitasatospora sp. NPDC096147]|uniref:sirohydrochlorin chelatase n=1 Tax=Kitasatospora sp. NPDC096147 TaxID=3364093 RepID=UPI0038028E5E